MKRIIQKMKQNANRIKFGKAQRLVEAAGATAFILIVMALLHPLYAAVTHGAYFVLMSLMILSMWGRAVEDYKFA